MGIKNFSKVFPNHGEVKMKDLKRKTIAVDAMYQLHRTAHPFNTTQTSILTAPDGSATNHINGLLALIFNLKKCGAYQVWIFDNPGEGHNSIKDIELERRRSQQTKAKEKLKDFLDHPILFSDDDGQESNEFAINKNKYERAAFSLDIYMINDLKFMLDSLNIPWIEAPPKVEAEHLAAHITNYEVDGIKADAVLTPDPDCLLFGAKMMIKNEKNKFFKYQLSILLKDADIQLEDLIKIGVILGSDFAEKTAGIGPGTVLAKFSKVALSAKQTDAVEYFSQPIPQQKLNKLRWKSNDEPPFSSLLKAQELFKWMTGPKGFSQTRTESRFIKVGIKL
jgi:hypothetical protein